MSDTQYTNVVEVFNRSPKDFEFTWDGRHFIVPGSGKKSMIEPAAWHGRRASVYNLSVYTLTGTPILGIVGVHDSEMGEELPTQVGTGEKINRDEIVESEGGHTITPKFSAGPMAEKMPPDRGAVAFGESAATPFDTKSKVDSPGIMIQEE